MRTPAGSAGSDTGVFDFGQELLADSFNRPVQVIDSGDGSDRLFVAEQPAANHNGGCAAFNALLAHPKCHHPRPCRVVLLTQRSSAVLFFSRSAMTRPSSSNQT
jgi:hypothetical protein